MVRLGEGHGGRAIVPDQNPRRQGHRPRSRRFFRLGRLLRSATGWSHCTPPGKPRGTMIPASQSMSTVERAAASLSLASACQVPRIFKGMAREAGLPAGLADRLSGHSTRVGAAQDMVAAGIGLPAILQAGRWKSPAMVNRYGERLLARNGAAAQLARIQGRGA